VIRVLLADDEALVRGGFRMILEAQDDIEVAGEASDGAGALEQARQLRPDVVLMDIRMPGMDGLEATRCLLAAGAVASIVWAWGVAQWPYILPTSLKVSAAAAPSATLTAVLVVFGIAAVLIVPSLALLYTLDQRSLLPEESVDSQRATGASTPAS